MISFQHYLDQALLKKQKPNFEQIKRQIQRAEKDLKTFNVVLNVDPEWSATIAYQAMLRAGGALLYAHGFLPTDGQQHKTVVEITGLILGKEYNIIIQQFERLRKKRNIFFYESEDAGNITEAKLALQTAQNLIKEIKKNITLLDPQKSFNW